MCPRMEGRTPLWVKLAIGYGVLLFIAQIGIIVGVFVGWIRP
jgi:hypothetical protein